jgi:hypothetical protein
MQRHASARGQGFTPQGRGTLSVGTMPPAESPRRSGTGPGDDVRANAEALVAARLGG